MKFKLFTGTSEEVERAIERFFNEGRVSPSLQFQLAEATRIM